MTPGLPQPAGLADDAGEQLEDSPAAAVRWEAVCPVSRLTPERGAAALVGGEQVAIFLLADGEVLAIEDRDPFSGATVLSRGLVGEAAGQPTVASPVYKQRFELRTGRCLEDEAVTVRTWPVRVHDGCIEVAVR